MLHDVHVGLLVKERPLPTNIWYLMMISQYDNKTFAYTLFNPK